MSVFEICDTSDDEVYFPLGMFATLDDAKSELDKFDVSKEKVSDRAEEHETITVFERPMGWTEHGKSALVVEREEYYDEDADEYYWRKVAS